MLDNASPMYSHIVLAQAAENSHEDGLLEAREMMNLDLKAKLVVLSACQTALGAGEEIVGEPESAGRKLEFLTQEMSREANTIGSKASDVDISRHVVEIKGALEKVRELVQNIE